MRHFLRDDDLSAAEQLAILDLADVLKTDAILGWTHSPGRGRWRCCSTSRRRGPGSPSRPRSPSSAAIR